MKAFDVAVLMILAESARVSPEKELLWLILDARKPAWPSALGISGANPRITKIEMARQRALIFLGMA